MERLFKHWKVNSKAFKSQQMHLRDKLLKFLKAVIPGKTNFMYEKYLTWIFISVNINEHRGTAELFFTNETKMENEYFENRLEL